MPNFMRCSFPRLASPSMAANGGDANRRAPLCFTVQDDGLVDEASGEARSQILGIELPSDQDQAIGAACRTVLVQGEASTDEVEDVALVRLGQPQEALAAEQARRAVVEKF